MYEIIIEACIILAFSLGLVLVGMFKRGRDFRLVYAPEKTRDGMKRFLTKMSAKIHDSEILKKYNEARLDREIYEGLSLLRNIALSGEEQIASTDYILMKLSQRKGILKETYHEMLSLVRTNKIAEAQKCFRKRCNTSLADEYAAILLSLDNAEARDLREVVISYQKNIREINATKNKKREELISDLIYFPAMINVLAIFMNFIYVGYFIEQKEMLQMFF